MRGYNRKDRIFEGNCWNILLFCKSIFGVLFLFTDRKLLVIFFFFSFSTWTWDSVAFRVARGVCWSRILLKKKALAKK